MTQQITHEEAVAHLYALMKYCYGENIKQCDNDCTLCINNGSHCVLFDGMYHSKDITRDEVWKRLKELKEKREESE